MLKMVTIIVLLGVLAGAIVSAIVMLLSFAIHYSLMAVESFFFPHFLQGAGIFALGLGIFCALAWYAYILFVARKFFFQIVGQYLPGKKEKK